ncbi:MAG: hypothetical protein KDK40_05955, partial [Chlamydiia bacterium]|nr:hypothetical protein [Chlamydiia bacterium]
MDGLTMSEVNELYGSVDLNATDPSGAISDEQYTELSEEVNAFEEKWWSSLMDDRKNRETQGRNRALDRVQRLCSFLQEELLMMVATGNSFYEARTRLRELIGEADGAMRSFISETSDYATRKQTLDERYRSVEEKIAGIGAGSEGDLKRIEKRRPSGLDRLASIGKEGAKVAVGASVNAVAMPFYILAKVGRTVGAVMQLAGIAEGCMEADPTDPQRCITRLTRAMNGGDPLFDEAMQEAEKTMPEWAKSAGNAFQSVNNSVKEADAYMANNFYTFPGIIHGAAEGVLDLTVGTAVGCGVKAVGRSLLANSYANVVSTAASVVGGSAEYRAVR